MREDSRNLFQMRSALFIASVLAVAAIAGTMLFAPPIGQSEAYHAFADTRTFFGIPNAWNVLSNLGFLIVGIMVLCGDRRPRLSAQVFGIGLVLTSIGSSIYHLQPNGATLLYDRAGMVVALMAVIALLIDQYDGRHELATLAVAETTGIASLVWWKTTGDLRLYGVVQFFPGLLILVLAVRKRTRPSLLWVIVFYAIAKACEQFDRPIFDALRVVSGHTLKHLAAAVATWVIFKWIQSIPSAARDQRLHRIA